MKLDLSNIFNEQKQLDLTIQKKTINGVRLNVWIVLEK